MAMTTCAKCDKRFTRVSVFDMHRTGGYGDAIYKDKSVVGYQPSTRRCLTAEEMLAKGLFADEKNVWHGPVFEHPQRWQGEKAQEPEPVEMGLYASKR